MAKKLDDEQRKKLEAEAIAKASLISANKESIAESAVDNPELNKKQTDQVIKHLDDDNEIARVAKESVGLEEPKKGGAAEQFKQALMFFAPQLVAGAVGGALEGEAGVVAGMEAGGQARDSYIQYQRDIEADQQKRDEIAKGKTPTEKPFQQAQQWMTTDGKPVFANPNTGKYQDLDGNIVDASKITNAINFRQTRALDFGEVKHRLSEDKFSHAITKDSQLSGKQQDELANLNTTIASGAILKDAFDKTETGQIIGRFNSMKEYFDSATPDAVKLKAHAASLRLFYQRAMSGLQVNEAEMKAISKIIPSEIDGPTTFAAKLEVFNELTAVNKENFLESISSGQPLKRDIADKLLKASEQFEDKPGQSPRGRSTMSQQQKSRLQELRAKHGRK